VGLNTATRNPSLLTAASACRTTGRLPAGLPEPFPEKCPPARAGIYFYKDYEAAMRRALVAGGRSF